MRSSTHWADAGPTAQDCLDHPFVTGLADGTLPRAAFQHYVGQDAFFLDAFARAYALCLAKAPDRATMGTFAELLGGAMGELDLHRAYARRWDVDLSPEPTAATRSYTDFLLQVAALEPVAHACAAMAPCMRLYAWLGQQLAPVAAEDSPYIEWVTTYADPGFEALAAHLESLVDTLPGDEATMARHHRTAMDLELAFFASAWTHGATS